MDTRIAVEISRAIASIHGVSGLVNFEELRAVMPGIKDSTLWARLYSLCALPKAERPIAITGPSGAVVDRRQGSPVKMRLTRVGRQLLVDTEGRDLLSFKSSRPNGKIYFTPSE